MILAHVSDSWTRAADRSGEPWYIVAFVGGVASPLFLFLAGVATAMAAASKGVALARRRGWEIFLLGLLFRAQSQLLGLGPVQNLFKVDMLNIMGLSMVLATYALTISAVQRTRVLVFAIITGAIAMLTPIVRDVSWLSGLPDPIEAYLRPAGTSPTFFFIRLGLVTLLVPVAWVLEQLLPNRVFAPIVTLGHSSLFVYWVHIELVYGVIAEPIKRTMPLWLSLTATALLTIAMYGLVLLKNRYLPGQLPRLKPRPSRRAAQTT
jgi:hypothetical protein